MPGDLNWPDCQVISDEWIVLELRFLLAYEWDRLNLSTAEKRRKVTRMISITEEKLGKLRRNAQGRGISETYPALMPRSY